MQAPLAPPPVGVGSLLPTPTPDEIATLEYMRLRLVHSLGEHNSPLARQPCFLPEPHGRQHRIIVLDPLPLLDGSALTFVGFFGQRRRNADTSALSLMDDELVGEMARSPQLLSYSSLELNSGEWVNFVLMRGPEGLRHWAGGERHSYAARTLAPSCYAAVRLHIGILPHGLDPAYPLLVQRVRHIGFGQRLP